MGISSRNDVFCMNKDCFLPQNRAFFRFISSELILFSSEEKGISSEVIAINSEIFGINRYFFRINATKKSKYIYIYLLLHPRVRTCVRERKFSRKYFWKRNRLYLQEKREKKKLRQKEKSKKKTPQCLWSSLYHFRGFTKKVRIPFLSVSGKPLSGSCRD